MYYIKRKEDGLYPYVFMCGEGWGCDYVKHEERNRMTLGFEEWEQADSYLGYLVSEYYLEDEYLIVFEEN